jgi:hypothetical protein
MISGAGIEVQSRNSKSSEDAVAPKPAKTGNQLEQVRTALRTAGKGALHSALYHWMRQNHDRLTALFEDSSPAWAILAETFGRMGLTDREGKSPAPKTVRMTWYRVRLDVTGLRARRARRNTSEPAPAVTFVSQTVTPEFSPASSSFASNADTREEKPPLEPEFRAAARTGSPRPLLAPGGSLASDPDPPRRKFGLAQLRGHPSSAPAPPPPAPEPERVRRSPEEVERIIAGMLSGAPKNPFRRDKGD